MRFILMTSIALVAAFWFVIQARRIMRVLPTDGQIRQVFQTAKSTGPSEVFDRKGRKIGEFSTRAQYYVEIKTIPPEVIAAFLAAEDSSFYGHNGLDWSGIARAATKNVRAGRIIQGASTITQQLARIYFLNRDKTWNRKIREIILAAKIERLFYKQEILEHYLNAVYFGNHAFGIEAAARHYFSRNASELTIEQAALLAGLLKAPSAYAPHRNVKKAKQRRNWVLDRLAKLKEITPSVARALKATPVRARRHRFRNTHKARFAVQVAKEEIARSLEIDRLEQKRLKVFMTIDLDQQEAAKKALAAGVATLQKEARRSKKGGKRRHQQHDLRIEGAILGMDPASGAVRFLQGSSNFLRTPFNRARRTFRSLGATFVPVYAALAMEKGFSLSSSVGFDPMMPSRTRQRGQTIYEALLTGEALAAAQLYVNLGNGTIRNFSRALGLQFRRSDLSLALGYGAASVEQVTAAYGALFNGGLRMRPYYIYRIEDGLGNVIFRRPRVAKRRVLSEDASFIVRHALRDVVRHGYAPAAQIQGTDVAAVGAVTDDRHNSWFIGTTPKILATVWVGSETGKVALAEQPDQARDLAGKVWVETMKKIPPAERGRRFRSPPSSVSFARTNLGKKSAFLPYIAGREPSRSRSRIK